MVYQSSNARAMSKSIQTTRGQSDANPSDSHKHRNGASYNNSNATAATTNAALNNNQVASHRPQARHSSATHQHDDSGLKAAAPYRQQQARRESFAAVPTPPKSSAQRSHSVTALSHGHAHANRQITHSNDTVNGECGRQPPSSEAGLYRNNHSFTMDTNSASLVDIYANDLAEVMDMNHQFQCVLGNSAAISRAFSRRQSCYGRQ